MTRDDLQRMCMQSLYKLEIEERVLITSEIDRRADKAMIEILKLELGVERSETK